MSRTSPRQFHGERSNASLSWATVAISLFVGVLALLDGRVHEPFFVASLVVVVLAPAIVLRSRRAVLPWEVSILALAPLVGALLAPDPFARQLTLYAGASVLALGVTLELHVLTEISLERWLAVALVTMLAAAFAAIWATIIWLRDAVAGTSVIASNARLMWLLIVAAVTGLFTGTLFGRYYRAFPGEELVSTPVDGIEESVFAAEADIDGQPTLEERFPVPEPAQRALVWIMRIGLGGIVTFGVTTADPGIVSNGIAMLVVTFLPTVLRRRYDLPFDTGLVLWFTFAAFLHALGSAYLYRHTFWWHNVTHPLSATLMGAVGYVAIRTLDERREDVYLQPSLVSAFVVLFVLSFGVFWEIGEFGFDRFATYTGLQMPLSQYGLDDTMTDLLFNTAGAIFVARWGLPYLTKLTDDVTDQLAT